MKQSLQGLQLLSFNILNVHSCVKKQTEHRKTVLLSGPVLLLLLQISPGCLDQCVSGLDGTAQPQQQLQ